jgi:hypothetical protein
VAVVVFVPLIGFGLALGDENPTETARSLRNDKINVFPANGEAVPGSNGLTPEGGATGNSQKPNDEGKLVGIR